MGEGSEKMVAFLKEVSGSIEGKEYKPTNRELLKMGLINAKEAFYIYDLYKNKIIYHQGITSLFGYQDDEIHVEFLFDKYHKDDRDTVRHLAKGFITYCLKSPFKSIGSVLQVTYRVKRSDGNYFAILSQSSPFKENEKGIMTHILVKYTDICFLNHPNIVSWNFNTKNLDEDAFKREIHIAYEDFFSKREKEIISEVALGKTNIQIGEKYNISSHTVATHRKNMRKKAKKNNAEDLIAFCKRNGII